MIQTLTRTVSRDSTTQRDVTALDQQQRCSGVSGVVQPCGPDTEVFEERCPVDRVVAGVDRPAVDGSGGPGRVRYRSYSRDFHAELTVDEHGVVIDYPGLGHRIP